MDSTTSPAPAYLGSVVRTALSFGGGWLVAKGYVTADQLPEVGGIVLGLVTLVWSLSHKVGVAKALKSATEAAQSLKA